jgi:hypothetical protein
MRACERSFQKTEKSLAAKEHAENLGRQNKAWYHHEKVRAHNTIRSRGVFDGEETTGRKDKALAGSQRCIRAITKEDKHAIYQYRGRSYAT